MKKRILLVGYNYFPEETGIGKYSGEMMEWLANRGYDCTVVTSYPYYPFWEVQKPYSKSRFWFKSEQRATKSGVNLKVYRCPIYVPSKPSGFKRILLDFSFLISACLMLFRLLPQKRFDIVITVAPSFLIGLLGVFYKSITNSKLLYHIQDLQIEAARDLNMIKSKVVINHLFALEKFILKNSDLVSSVSEGMVHKIREKALKEITLFPNWADTSKFYPLANCHEYKADFGFSENDRIILYSGAIGEKQGLESIITAASDLACHKDWKFVICGSGPYKANLQKMAEKQNLQNVIFFPVQPIHKFNQFLNIADVHLVIQKANACDLVMPSKLTTILAVGGVALVTANPGSSLYALVYKHKMGLLVEAENQQALNNGICKALLSACKEEISANARHYAQNFLSIENIMNSYESQFASLQTTP